MINVHNSHWMAEDTQNRRLKLQQSKQLVHHRTSQLQGLLYNNS